MQQEMFEGGRWKRNSLYWEVVLYKINHRMYSHGTNILTWPITDLSPIAR